MSGIKGLISCTAWVARGVAAAHPHTYEVDEKELERISAIAQLNIDEAKAELDEANAAAEDFKDISSDAEETEEVIEDDKASADEGDVDMKEESDEKDKRQKKSKEDTMDRDDELAEYNLDDYDEEQPTSGTNIFSNIKGLSYYADNAEDPYITLHDEDEEEAQELEIRPSDNLIVTAKTEDHVSSLEIYVYDESEDNLYAHHDILLPSFPVCLEWLDYPPSSSTADSKTGNYIAVGTLDPDIEIWSLDVIESTFPDALLGDPKNKTRDETGAPILSSSPTKKKERKRRKPKANPDYHIDAVLGLSWNRSHRNLLASASADKTVKLWDLSRELNSAAIRSFDLHQDKVQAVQWNRVEPTVLLTGSYDRTVRTFDSRSPTSGFGARLPSDVEALKWDPWDSHSFYVSLENGLVLYYDARTLPSDLSKETTARFTIQAHDGAASGLDINPHVRGLIATGGTDNFVKLWNVTEEQGATRVKMLTSRNLEVGKVFSVTWSPDDPLTLAAAGSEAKLQIWDVGVKSGVKDALEDKLPKREWRHRDRDVIGLADDAEDDSDDEA
ncbi:hypothetical protein FRC04_011734 [Tulasnella sp. 424]|nr:hypothetical protein FRC04_011734 [Tulasnella sp. 424]KAG8978078.1 hypothetical protein FRC05_011194 [Tulasnella sp. 425]